MKLLDSHRTVTCLAMLCCALAATAANNPVLAQEITRHSADAELLRALLRERKASHPPILASAFHLQDPPASDPPVQDPAPAPAADPPAATQPDDESAAQDGETTKAPSERTLSAAGSPPPAVAFFPDLGGTSLHWFAVVVILMLSIRTRPMFCWRNLDGIMLSVAALLLLYRTDAADVPLYNTGHTWQWWSYLALTGVTAYWMLRGILLTFSRRAVSGDCNVSEGAMLALILAALALGFGTIVTAPLTAGSRDGLIGGIHFLENNRLPYGDVPGIEVGAPDHDSRSPLLYLAHAGAAKLLKPTMTDVNGAPTPLTMKNRLAWEARLEDADLGAVRLVNGSLFVLVLLGLLVIGSRMHSTAIGLTMFVLFAVFPGSLENLNHPDVMLPAALLTWGVACALLPGVGGVLSGLLIVLAGAAWPWAWLALPPLLGHFLRRGGQGLAAIGGVVAGFALVGVGVTMLTAPSLPRANGALAAAGKPTSFVARADESNKILVASADPESSPSTDFKSWFWRWLVDGDETPLRVYDASTDRPAVEAAPGTELKGALYHSVSAEGEVRRVLQRDYRTEVAKQSSMARVYAAFRTVAEATWLPSAKPASEVTPPWAVWLGRDAASADRITNFRRMVKIGAGVLSVLIGVLLFIGRRTRPHQLLGGLLAVCCAALAADDLGAAFSLAWIVPLVLCLWSLDEETRAGPPPTPIPTRTAPPSYGVRAPTPRITIEG